jgi:hypothetical protein
MCEVLEQVEKSIIHPTLASCLRQRPTGDSGFLPAVAIAQKAKVGWEQRLLQVDFAAPAEPAPADVVFEGEVHFLAVPATYEWILPALQSSRTFQALCDQAGSDLRQLAAVLGASPVTEPTAGV